MVGALPFLCEAQEKADNRYLDDYRKPIGFTYGAHATLNSSYLWRGFYAGALNVQGGANVGFGGLYADLWCSIGTTDWSFTRFQPEVDVSLGFARWGLDVFLLYIHNFDCKFFDFSNHVNYGNRLELDLRYTVSSKLPLSFLWATRVSASDGYVNAAGDTIRTWSSYAELSYTHHFPFDISLYGAVGITPWRSGYTGYEGNFAVNNVEVRLRKDWSVGEHCGLRIQGSLACNPYALARDKSSARWYPTHPGYQSVNANVAVGVYLK